MDVNPLWLVGVVVAGAGLSIVQARFVALRDAHAQFLKDGIRAHGTVLRYGYSVGLFLFHHVSKVEFEFILPGEQTPIRTEQLLSGIPRAVVDVYPPGTSIEIAYLKHFPKLAVPVPLLKWCML